MVLNVDDWIETNNGDIGLIVDTVNLGRASGAVAVYRPDTVDCVDVPACEVRAKFLRVLA